MTELYCLGLCKLSERFKSNSRYSAAFGINCNLFWELFGYWIAYPFDALGQIQKLKLFLKLGEGNYMPSRSLFF